jgi:small subunit ribosomal protein S20
MPIIKSAKKRVRVTKKATSNNLRTKRQLRAAQKEVRLAKDQKSLSEAQKKNQSALDKAGKKGIMHKHKVARKQRQLAAKVKASSLSKPTAKKTTTKKPSAAAKK